MDLIFKLIIKCVLLVLFFTIVISCGIGPIKQTGFNNYKKPIIVNTTQKINTNGVFVYSDSLKGLKNRRKSYTINKNGTYGIIYFNESFWDHPEKSITEKIDHYQNFKFRNLGHYHISNDTIIFQYFGQNNNEFYSRWVIEDKGKIIDENTIQIFSSYSYLRKDTLLQKSYTIKFYKTNFKLDSTNAWYKNKKWYKNSLHGSRY